ncbi:hypothetical protein GFV12_05125 [Desulfurobacterium thermolithotrophum]|uniref:hypothetical protein n=1 Tax=Desulfurobacterium thermolithotrophum TaxID=64160 RepID=UPI0013D59F29|nr:hypothetical protein [Desulfurobacterium thermolithotrophum]
MENWQKALRLLRKKEKDVHLTVNPELWELFRKACKKEGTTPNQKISELVLRYLEETGILDEYLK